MAPRPDVLSPGSFSLGFTLRGTTFGCPVTTFEPGEPFWDRTSAVANRAERGWQFLAGRTCVWADDVCPDVLSPGFPGATDASGSDWRLG
ncbi:hypothetical protein P171DRAFT_433684 [Karstenula rhodostoma CBS 690.94]|uniref:Uncharacterized protein n=1 Tax=Karstenula rhodostoma CBS 690.94 TaxID=1392251 RepID=A0A9P4PDR4_9PLEO|nr:hypothetical protein P171DRAFT_433684 [Karstenula rhodostoma CBS 690.94]